MCVCVFLCFFFVETLVYQWDLTGHAPGCKHCGMLLQRVFVMVKIAHAQLSMWCIHYLTDRIQFVNGNPALENTNLFQGLI